MLNVRSILFPTDFSWYAESAFAHAAHLAARYGAELHVFNVALPHEPEQSDPMAYLPVERWEDPNQLYLASGSEGGLLGWEHREYEGKDVRVVYRQMRSPSPSMAILDYADEHDIDLVVMGTRGRQGVDRWLGGSVAEEIVREAACPVLVARADDSQDEHQPVRRLLVPVDFSKHTQRALLHAIALASAYDAALDLLHVIEDISFPAAYGGPLTPPPETVETSVRDALEELDVPPDLPVDVHVRGGYPGRDIVEFAQEHDTDLIVMATHGRTGLRRFLLGSVTEKVVRTAPCPVFTVKSFGKSLVEDTEATADERD